MSSEDHRVAEKSGRPDRLSKEAREKFLDKLGKIADQPLGTVIAAAKAVACPIVPRFSVLERAAGSCQYL